MDGHDIGDVAQAGEKPDRPAAAHEEGEHGERPDAGGEGGPGEGDDDEPGARDHGALFAEAGDEPAGGDIEGEDADPAKSDDETGESDGCAFIARGEGDDGDDGALANGEEEGRDIDRQAKRAQGGAVRFRGGHGRASYDGRGRRAKGARDASVRFGRCTIWPCS